MANSHSAPTGAALDIASRLPNYIVERNQRASAAGLTIEKQALRRNELVTWYRGTEEQWRASSFCQRRPDRPFLRSNSKMPPWDFCWFTPERGFGPGPVLRPVSCSEFRGTFAEDLPDWCEHVGDEIAVYGMGSVVVYVGTPSGLIEHKIAPPEIEQEERSWGRDNSGPVIWDSERLPDGRYVYRDHVGVREKIAQDEKAKQRRAYTTPAEMLERWAGWAVCQMAYIQDQFTRVETSSGKIYTVKRESLDEIGDALGELAYAIRNAEVTERDADPGAKQIRHKAAVAREDLAFQGFLAGLQLVDPNDEQRGQ